jgi:ribosome-binding protein aMBF1 (putative translation factor)
MKDDLEKYVEKRKRKSPDFERDFESGYADFRIGVVLKQARKQAGFTQAELAKKLRTKKSAISRLENHAQDIRLSTVEKIARALGKQVYLRVG